MALNTFNYLRLPYKGCKETVKSIEVDVLADRVYAASNEGIYVWELKSHKPVALLRSSQWINSVRCYPPLLSQSGDDGAASPSTHLVSGDEDGRLTIWDLKIHRPTYKLQVCPGAITNTFFFVDSADRAQRLCAVSLTDVYIAQVQPTRIELVRSLQHSSTCTAAAYLSSLYVSYLLVGLDSGAIMCWSTRDWTHGETLAYPAAEDDVWRDQREAGAGIQNPTVLSDASLANTFEYNKRRFGNPRDSGYRSHLSTAEEARQFLVRIETDPAVEKVACMLKGAPYKETSSRRISPAFLHYDKRRVCSIVAGMRSGGAVSQRFFSGHADGDVLIWESSHRSQLFLLKALRVFKPLVWVSLTAMNVPRSSLLASNSGNRPTLQQQVAKKATTIGNNNNPAAKKKESSDGLSVLQVFASGNDGEVAYIQTSRSAVATAPGPGFASTASQFLCSRALPNPIRETDAPPNEHRHYLFLGSFEGRLERFDISATVTKLAIACPTGAQ